MFDDHLPTLVIFCAMMITFQFVILLNSCVGDALIFIIALARAVEEVNENIYTRSTIML
jgi:hypothetical protein